MRNIDLFNSAIPETHRKFINIENIPKIRMQQASDFFSHKKVFQLQDFVNVAPPFNDFYFEYNMHYNDSESNPHLPVSIAGIIHSTKEIHGWTMTVMFAEIVCGVIQTFNAMIFQLDVNGNFGWDSGGKMVFDTYKSPNYDAIENSEDLCNTLCPLFIGLSFCHCKTQVEMQTELVDKKLLLKHINEGKVPVERWHILNIEPVKKMLKEYGRKNNVTDKMALHLCRGHFMDYRDGKGLFGKYKGIYWQPPHFKGKKENGVVNKEYNV